MTSVSAFLEPRLAQPFGRALMRVQAELLLEDADRLGQENWQDRTHEQRAADAFVALALRVADAANS
jgi:sugar diacid utilization regulator